VIPQNAYFKINIQIFKIFKIIIIEGFPWWNDFVECNPKKTALRFCGIFDWFVEKKGSANETSFGYEVEYLRGICA